MSQYLAFNIVMHLVRSARVIIRVGAEQGIPDSGPFVPAAPRE